MKKFLLVFASIFVTSYLYSATVSDVQMIPENSWVYDAIYSLSMESQHLPLIKSSPLSVAELKILLNRVSFEDLSDSGRVLYEEVRTFLYDKPDFYLHKDNFNFNAQILVNPEVYFKSNDNIPWSHDYYYIDNCLSLPVNINVTPYFEIDMTPFAGKNYHAMQKSDSITNIPYVTGHFDDFKFIFPTFATGSTAIVGDGWNINFRTGKQGLSIFKTRNGSIVVNDTFETEGYAQAVFGTDYFSYTLDILEFNPNRSMYIHQLDFRLFEKTTFSVLEAGLPPVGGIELRFLNPLMIFHSFGGWKEYGWPDYESKYFGEMGANYTSYLAAMLETSPFKNSRFYLSFAMTELTGPGEPRHYPDGIGLQGGIDYDIPLPNKAAIYTNGEFFYTSPFLYIKPKASVCLYNSKMEAGFGKITKTWLGFPDGPDTLGGSFTVGYRDGRKWSLDLTWITKAKGEIDISWIEGKNITLPNGQSASYYYPTRTGDTVLRDAMLPTGVVEYSNTFAINGEYNLNKHFSFNGKALYTSIKNFKHVTDNSQNGFELSLSGTYRVF